MERPGVPSPPISVGLVWAFDKAFSFFFFFEINLEMNLIFKKIFRGITSLHPPCHGGVFGVFFSDRILPYVVLAVNELIAILLFHKEEWKLEAA